MTLYNKTDQDVQIWWYDFDGKPVKYQTITARGSTKQQTYVGHKWDARASVQSENLFVMNGQDIYAPTSDNLRPEVAITVKECTEKLEEKEPENKL